MRSSFDLIAKKALSTLCCKSDRSRGTRKRKQSNKKLQLTWCGGFFRQFYDNLTQFRRLQRVDVERQAVDDLRDKIVRDQHHTIRNVPCVTTLTWSSGIIVSSSCMSPLFVNASFNHSRVTSIAPSFSTQALK